MKQEDLKDYLELAEHDCYVYKTKTKSDGIHYFMRKRGTTLLVVLFPPKNGSYKEENVCHICNVLQVPTHVWAKGAQQTLDDALKNSGEGDDPGNPNG